MPIGDGPDCYNGINKKEDEQIRLQEMVDKWWYSLDHEYKRELLDAYYDDDKVDLDQRWNSLDWNDKWEIYRDEKDEIYP